MNKKLHEFIKVFSARAFVITVFFCLTVPVYSQSKFTIDYFGIVAAGVDDNMSKMTSDLYYTQLCELNTYIVNDRRNGIKMDKVPSSSDFSDGRLSFYAVITKKENSSKWISTINLYDSSRKSTLSEAKEYDSFYKILMEPKSTLKETITALLSGTVQISDSSTMPKTGTSIQSTEFLSGNWGGEDSIDKIVIMRGGRGFVIFKNGASMNITVEIKQEGGAQKIIISQYGKANASFFPELPRETALKAAVNADPVKWIFSAEDDDTLTGTKYTLINKDGEAVSGTISVKWKRKS